MSPGARRARGVETSAALVRRSRRDARALALSQDGGATPRAIYTRLPSAHDTELTSARARRRAIPPAQPEHDHRDRRSHYYRHQHSGGHERPDGKLADEKDDRLHRCRIAQQACSGCDDKNESDNGGDYDNDGEYDIDDEATITAKTTRAARPTYFSSLL